MLLMCVCGANFFLYNSNLIGVTQIAKRFAYSRMNETKTAKDYWSFPMTTTIAVLLIPVTVKI